MGYSGKRQTSTATPAEPGELSFWFRKAIWPAPGSEDTEFGVLMEPEVGHGETTEVHTRVQA